MTAYVVDASALVNALVGNLDQDGALRARMKEATCHSPHLIDAELGSVLRRLTRAGLAPEDAGAALDEAADVIDVRHAHAGALVHAAWALRANVSFYDALYAALAGRLGFTLLTADGQLARAPGLPCAVELV